MASINETIERKLLPIANKMANWRYLKAIRDSFLTLLPITLTGGIASVLGAAPFAKEEAEGFFYVWAVFAENANFILTWINTVTIGALAFYFGIGITYYLCRHYKIHPFTPLLVNIVGFLMLVVGPQTLGWDGTIADLSYIGGKGLIPAMIISIFTVEAYRFMTAKNFGRIKMPPSVPEVLSDTFANMVPCIVIILVFSLGFVLFHSMGTTMAGFLYMVIAPSFAASDNIVFLTLVILVTHFLFFFGIHDTAITGFVGPIRESNLAVNAAAQLAGEPLQFIYTTPFWVYFVIIGGCGSVLALGILLLRSKSKMCKYVGRIGIIPSFFGINEPIVFGLPVVLNPIFFIPFMLAPLVNGIAAYLLMSAGILEKTFALLSWNMPNIFGAFLSTMDWKGVVFIIVFTIVDALIYYPFFKVYEKQQIQLETEGEGEEDDE
ncbi:PTS sugar transporter subunit IIC [Enorma burkinafasonensis]|uniref:PTS sugar transporter subunit IIC n=1 Tax=Enorma burkinafasonensis TaxID=2590867 RepID=UPI0011AA06FA|nr:PTS transporter subunit EIIC [Enorma burkinafasonensis]